MILAFAAAPVPAAGVGLELGACDFDGDGYADLVVGVPGEDGTGSGEIDAGAINVFYGSASGVSSDRSRLWTQDFAGVPGRNNRGDRFGAAHECGDFDADGHIDLAVGAPGESTSELAEVGAVTVFYGGGEGLGERIDRWWAGSPGVKGAAGAQDRFGNALASSDFDDDGFPDLAIGAPGTDEGAGALHVLFGSSQGLTDLRDERWTQDSAGVRGRSEVGDGFARALAAGDFDGDGYADLGVGVPGESVGGMAGAGALNVLRGGEEGMSPSGVAIHFDVAGIKGIGRPWQHFGGRLAAEDFDADGFFDLVASAPGYAVGGRLDAGAVSVLYGSSLGIRTRDAFFHQATPGVIGVTEAGDRFGWGVSGGDFDGDGFADLAIGAPLDSHSGTRLAGTVTILHGSATGVTTRMQRINQTSDGVSVADVGGAFGITLRTADYDGDGDQDLTIGMANLAIGSSLVAGAVQVTYGNPGGLSASADGRWHQDSAGVPGASEAGDGFGFVSAVEAGLETPAAMISLRPRSAWEARDAIPSLMTEHTIERLTVHHAGDGGRRPTGPHRFRSWQNWHMDGRDWGDIAYHFIIGIDGAIYEARDLRYEGDTGTRYDTTSHFLVVVEGDFDIEQPTQAQLDSLAELLAWASVEFGVSSDTITGHRDHAPGQTCPGHNLYPHLTSGDLAANVDALLVAGGVLADP